MLTKRIIPCLDIKDGRTVKGINFVNIRDAGDPVELGAAYAQQGADELVFLDISATNEKRKTFAALVKEIATHINIPFTVGGGITSVGDVAPLLEAGADKVSINSSAVQNPELIDQLAKAFGSQFVVLAIDARKIQLTKFLQLAHRAYRLRSGPFGELATCRKYECEALCLLLFHWLNAHCVCPPSPSIHLR